MTKDQTIITPAISKCLCGLNCQVKHNPYPTYRGDDYRVECDNGHYFTKYCSSKHRAICLHNNRVKSKTITRHSNYIEKHD